MSNRIEVRTPSQVIEASDAIQAANRRRLERRTAEGWTERRAARLVQDGLRFADSQTSRAAANDPWKGAVPEFDPVPAARGHLFGKRFKTAGATWRWDSAGLVRVSTADGTVSQQFAVPIEEEYSTGDPQPKPALDWYFPLPGGNDRLVILFGGETVSATQSAYRSFKNDLASKLDLPPTDKYGLPINITGDPWMWLTEKWNSYTYSIVRTSKCAIITKDAVKIITPPSILADLIRQQFSIRDVTAVPSDSEKILYYEGPNNPGDTVEFLQYDLTGTPGLSQTLVISTEGAGYQYESYITWAFLTRSYGYGHLISQTTQVPAWGVTPASFAYLRHYAGEFHNIDPDGPEVQNASNYKYIRDNYFPQDAPKYMLSAGYQPADVSPEIADLTSTYHYFRAPVDETASAVEPDAFQVPPLVPKLNGGTDTTEPINLSEVAFDNLEMVRGSRAWESGDPVPVIAWDWGRPIACILALLDLGFTTGDLMLTDAETAALEAADLATAKFNFMTQ